MKSILPVFAALLSLAINGRCSELREGTLDSDLVPRPVNFAVLLPDGYESSNEAFPLLLILHGGKNSHKEMSIWKEIIDELSAEGKLSKMVVAMPGTGQPTLEGRSEYVDFHDGSEKWFSFVIGPFLSHVRKEYRVIANPSSTAICGFSMGGLGALRFAFSAPDKFAGVVGWEPSVLPAFYWRDVRPRNRFHYSDEFLERLYGRPFEKNWEANNPALIVKSNADAIRKSGIRIYIECGDEDFLNLQEGTEFLHRVLWDARVKHEYHSVRGADHLGRTVKERAREGLQFVERAIHPLGEDRSQDRLQLIEDWRDQKKRAEEDPRNDVNVNP